MERIVWGGMDKVAGKDDDDNNEGVDPGVTKGEVFPPAEETMRFSTFRMRTGDFGLRIALRRSQQVGGNCIDRDLLVIMVEKKNSGWVRV